MVCGQSGAASVPFCIAGQQPGPEVLHEPDRPQDGVGQAQLLDVLLDAVLGLEVRDARVAVGAAHRGVDEVPDARGFGDLGQQHPLLHFGLHAGLERGGHGEDPVAAAHGRFDAGAVVEVPAHDLGAGLGQRPGRLRFPRQSADPLAPLEEGLGHGRALLAGRPGHQNVLGKSHNASLLRCCPLPLNRLVRRGQEIVMLSWRIILGKDAKMASIGGKGMKLIKLGFWTAVLVLASLCPRATWAQRPRWSEQQANDWYARQPWLVGSNYVPQSAINQLEMWQAETFDPDRNRPRIGLGRSPGHEHHEGLSS